MDGHPGSEQAAAGPPGTAIEPARFLRLVLLGALIGVPAALAAAGFLVLVHELQHLLWHSLPHSLGHDAPPWWLLLALPALGGTLVLAAERLLPGDGGHEPLRGISAEPTALRLAPGILLAAVGSLAFGAVLGPEGPLLALGGAVGLAIERFFPLAPAERRVMATAGSFSAVSAVFRGPLSASVMLVEAGIGMGALLVPALLPGLVAAAVGYTVFTGVGSWPGLESASLVVPDLPVYAGTRVLDLLLAVAGGVLAALLVRGARDLAIGLLPARRRLGATTLPLAGLVLGLLAWGASGLGVDSLDVLFSGQTSVPALVGTATAGTLVVLLVAKALAFAVCLAAGFRGGPVFPAIFLGIGVMSFAVIWLDVSPTLAVAVGTAAGMTAMTSFLFTSVLFAGLLVGSAGVDALPAAVLAAASSWLTVQALTRTGRFRQRQRELRRHHPRHHPRRRRRTGRDRLRQPLGGEPLGEHCDAVTGQVRQRGRAPGGRHRDRLARAAHGGALAEGPVLAGGLQPQAGQPPPVARSRAWPAW